MRRLIKIDFLHVSSRFCLLQPDQNLLFLRRSNISGKDTGKVILLIKKYQRLLVFVHRLTPKRVLRFTGMQCRKRCLSKMPDVTPPKPHHFCSRILCQRFQLLPVFIPRHLFRHCQILHGISRRQYLPQSADVVFIGMRHHPAVNLFDSFVL